VACMGVNKWGCLADHAQELQQARKLPLAPETVVRVGCAASLLAREEREREGESRRSPSIPNPPLLLLYAASTASSPDHCFPCATALQICLPPALMSAASQRRGPTAKLLQDARRALGSPAAAECLCWAHPQDEPGPGVLTAVGC
jgi:hypothetical protein